MHKLITALAAFATLASGCSIDGLSVDQDTFNGRYLNGRYLNGRYLNGTNLAVVGAYPLPGIYQGKHLDGTWLDGSKVSEVEIFATELSGKHEGSTISGTAFEGAMMPGLDSNGDVVKLYLQKIYFDAPGLYYYEVIALTSEGKYPLCGVDKDATGHKVVLPAIAIAGIWNHHQGNPGDGGKIPESDTYGITFACPDVGATAKCVQMGYWPWLSAEHDLAHQGCVRMVRADYCGDGRSWTHNGTDIDVEDELPLQSFESYVPGVTDEWVFEATWGPDGASCIENFRYSTEHPDFGSIEKAVRNGDCPNMPVPVKRADVIYFFNELPQGGRANNKLCGWKQPDDCDPDVQTCPVDRSDENDYFGHTIVNAKGPGTW